MLGLSIKLKKLNMADFELPNFRSWKPLKWQSMRARMQAHAQLEKLNIEDGDYEILSLFLRGKNPDFNIINDMSDEDTKKLELLTGSHALTVLKIGLLRQGISLKKLKRKK